MSWGPLQDEVQEAESLANTMVRSQQRTNELLAALVSANGTIELPEASPNIPFGFITIPDDKDYLGLPPGRTTVNLSEGRIENQHVGTVTEDVLSIEDLSRSLDASTDKLRSLYVYVDSPAQLSLDGDSTVTLEAGEHYEVSDSGFTSFVIDSEYALDFTAVASTRRGAFSAGGTTAHSERKGSRAEDTYNSWTDIPVATPNVWNNYSTTNYPETPVWYVRPFDNTTIQVQNGSSAANDVDVRILAADTRDPNSAGSNDYDAWYEIGKITNLSQNQRHKFTINESHHAVKVQFQNSTDTNTVTAGMTGVASN